MAALMVLPQLVSAQVKVYDLQLTSGSSYEVSVSKMTEDSVSVRIDNSLPRSFAISDVQYLGSSEEVLIEDGVRVFRKTDQDSDPEPTQNFKRLNRIPFDSALVHPFLSGFISPRSIGSRLGVHIPINQQWVPMTGITYQQQFIRDGQFIVPSAGLNVYAPIGFRQQFLYLNFEGGYGFNITSPESYQFEGTPGEMRFISKKGGSFISTSVGMRNVLKSKPEWAIEYGLTYKRNRAFFEYETNLQLSNGEQADRVVKEWLIYNRLELVVRLCL
jgi:hypothetical protein